MSEQPAPPQLSPDGKFYWDGQRWVPMPAQASRSTGRSCLFRGCLIVVLLVLILIVGLVLLSALTGGHLSQQVPH